MKAYFTQLFNYDYHTNRLILESIIAVDSPPESVRLMAHILGAQQVWLSRCLVDPSIGNVIWPEWQVDQLARIMDDNYRLWINYIDGLNAGDFDKRISFKNSQGLPFNDKLVDILAHVINHGTHHRAQIGQDLKFAGLAKLPITDYIFYVRNL